MNPISTKTPKFRPYLSLEEIAILITAASSVEFTTPALDAAIASLTKTKILAEHGVKTSAYITNPRKTLEDKLEFSKFTGHPIGTPDFNAMMDSLNSLTVTQTKETK